MATRTAPTRIVASEGGLSSVIEKRHSSVIAGEGAGTGGFWVCFGADAGGIIVGVDDSSSSAFFFIGESERATGRSCDPAPRDSRGKSVCRIVGSDESDGSDRRTGGTGDNGG
jgi:hypothetical protein